MQKLLLVNIIQKIAPRAKSGKHLNNTAPEYLSSRFVRRCDLTSYNLRENEYKLAVPQPRTEFYKRSLSYSGSVLWNGLPLEVWQLTSPSIFKGKLKDINFD